MVERAADKVPLIRIQAALGLSRLQDVEEGANAASHAYIRLLSSDPNKEVRRTALNNLVTSKHTLGAILDRVRDTHVDVRVDTFRLLTTNVRMKTLTIKQRIHLLQSGMRDREASVRKECNNMLVEWLKGCGASVTTLLKAFDVTNTDDKLIEMLIETMLEHVSLDSVGWRKADALTPELAILWRVFIKWHVERKNTDIVEENLPDSLIEFCELVTTIVTENTVGSSYILRQILQLAPLMDKADEGGRRAIVGLLSEIAAENFVDEKDVEYLARAIYTFSFGMEDFLSRMDEAITRARHLLETFEREESTQLIEKQEARMAELKRKMGPSELKRFIKQLEEEDAEGEDDVAAIMMDTDTSKANDEEGESMGSWKKELRVLLTLKKNRTRVSEWGWIRTLTLVQQIFAHAKISDLDPAFSSPAVIEMLNGYVPKYVAVAMSNPHVQVRLAAMRALGGLATLEVKFNAIHHVELLYHALSNDQVEVKDEALKILFDLIMTAGFEIFDAQSSGTTVEARALDEAGNDANGVEMDGTIAESEKKKPAYQPREEDFEEISAPFEYPQQSVFSVLYNHLSSTDSRLLTTAVEGFTKLYVAKKIACPRTLSALLVLLFDPETNENATLQQSLSLFLPMFAFASYNNQRLFAEAFWPTLRRFLYAESDSSLADVHVATFLRFMLHVTDWQQLVDMHKQRGKKTALRRPENSPVLHNMLAVDVCLEILVAPGSVKNVKTLVKFFSYYPIDTTDMMTTRRLEYLINKAAQAISGDKMSMKAMMAVSDGLSISKTLPALTEEDIAALESLIAESTDSAVDTLDREVEERSTTSNATSRAKKPVAPPKSTKKLFATKARRGVLEDSDDDLMNSDSDSDSSSGSSEDDEPVAPIRKSSSSAAAKKSSVKRTSSNASAKDSKIAKEVTSKTSKSASASMSSKAASKSSKSVARVLYADDEELDSAVDDMQLEDEDNAYLNSAPAPKRRALADEDSDDPIPSRVSPTSSHRIARPPKTSSSSDDESNIVDIEDSDGDLGEEDNYDVQKPVSRVSAKTTRAKATKSTKASKATADEEEIEEDDEVVKKTAKRGAAGKKSASSSSTATTSRSKASAAKKSTSKTLSKTNSTGSITDEEKENAQNIDDPITRTGSSLSGKLASMAISKGKTSRRKAAAAAAEDSEEEFEDSDAEVIGADSDGETPVAKTKSVRANVALARAAAATKVQRPTRAAASKAAEQSKLMKEMSTMLD